MKTARLSLLLALTILVALPAAADQAAASNTATPPTETAPARPAEDPSAEPGADAAPEVGLFVPEAQEKLYCSEYCGQGVSVECSCPGSGTCHSQTGWDGWVECLCDGATDDEDHCPGYGQSSCENPPVKCIPGAACTLECGCAEGTCIRGTCNCLA